MKPAKIILASTSPIRRSILEGVGLSFTVARPCVDEASLKKSALAKSMPVSEIALKLAIAKANNIEAEKHSYIIGADQILEMDGHIYDKPKTMEEARGRLLAMRGKTHHLIGALTCLNKAANKIWTHNSQTNLTMRKFSDEYLDKYLQKEGEEILYTVGAYKFEGRGAGLFEHVEGDFYSILGLPLLPLLSHLRSEGVIKT